MREWLSVILPIITLLLGGATTYFFDRAKTQSLRKKAEHEQRLSFYQQMKLHLDAGRDAFVNQCIARDRLVVLLGNNHGPLPPLQYEPLFRQYYPVLNEDEKVLFQLIRGITKTSLYKHNKEMVDLLQAYPAYYHELPGLRDLRDHLELWMSKYDSLLANRDDTCLVYVGVEEGKPFPPVIDAEIEQKLVDLQENGAKSRKH